MICYNFEKEKYDFLPESGGYYDQDPYIMAIWICIMNEIRKATRDQEFRKAISIINKKG